MLLRGCGLHNQMAVFSTKQSQCPVKIGHRVSKCVQQWSPSTVGSPSPQIFGSNLDSRPATRLNSSKSVMVSSLSVRARMQIAASYYRADSAKGLLFAQEVVTIEPDYPFGHYLLGLLYLDTRDVPHAIRELETAARMVPTEPQFQYSLASAYSRAGRTDDAARARAAFTRLGGTHPPGTGEGTERPRLELDRPQ